MAHKSDICTLVWPRPREADGTIQPMDPPGAWIVGWNPRGLSVVVACFLENINLATAQDRVQVIKSMLATTSTPPGCPPYKALLLLGYVRRGTPAAASPSSFLSPLERSVGSPNTQLPSVPHMLGDADVRIMRQNRDLWLELVEGPMLGDVWCCGYRVQPCQLHVIRCDTRRTFTVQPVPLMPCALYGPAGVRMLMEGKEPICAPGVKSNVEGVLLPKVMIGECGPQFQKATGGPAAGREPDHLANHAYTPRRASFVANTSIVSRSGAASFAESEVDPRSFEHSVTEDTRGQPRSRLGLDLEMDALSMSHFPDYPSSSSEPGPAPPPGVPPRLGFPTTVDRAEMNMLLLMSEAGTNVTRVLQGESPMSPAGDDTTADEADSEAARHGQSGLVIIVVPFLIRLLSFTCRVIGPLRRFSWFAELADQRMRELTNLFAMLSGQSTSCGLHPVLPHRMSRDSGRQQFCYWNYVVRLLADVIIGMGFMMLLIVRGPSMYAEAQYISRFFLCKMHKGYMEWFEGWPAGLKMNGDLNKALCLFAETVLHSWDAIMRGRFWPLVTSMEMAPTAGVDYFWIVPSYDVLVYVFFLGASGACALVADITGLVAIHLIFLYHAMSLPYRFGKAILSSLWQQLRGKKYNPLRKREDSYDFGVDQVFMATFLFVIAVFLFPTVAVHYFYFAFIRTTVWTVQGLLISMAHLILYTPIFPLLHRAFAKPMGSGGVALSDPVVTMIGKTASSCIGAGIGRELVSTTIEVSVEPLPRPLGGVLAEFAVVFGALAKPLMPSRVMSLIVRGILGRPPSPCEVLVPHLLADCISPPCTLCVPAKSTAGDTASSSL